MLSVTLAVGILILQDTGEQRGGLPVFRHHPDAARYERVLTHGFAGRLLRLYQIEQRVSHPEREPEPAILCLTQNQGGFPRKGFVLDGVARQSSYVDLHERSDLTGRPGAIDQIFPHELMHIILRDLAGARDEGRASQVHAIGVTTDRLTAFDEGLAEHAQVMAIDAADAEPDTRALSSDARAYLRALADVERYRRALTARWSIAPRASTMFPFWFSGTEQVLRYHAVRLNLFAREPTLGRLGRPYNVYLLENVLPGTVSDRRKPLARLLATEGAISTLFTRWVADPALQGSPAPYPVYGRFGVDRASLDPIDNAYVKLFAAFAERPHDLVAFVRAYDEVIPGDAEAVSRVVDGVFGVRELPDLPEVWLVNADMPNGRSLFDQFRAMPRPHAFDLNAASMGDLLGVPGVDAGLARAILAGAPYRSVLHLDRVSGLDASVRARFERMADAAARPEDHGDDESGLTIRTLLMPYARYAAAVLAAVALVAGLLYRAVRRVRVWRAALNGAAVALVGLAAGWIGDNGSGIVGWLVPMIVLGTPAALVAAARQRTRREAGRVLAAWALAACVPFLVLRPIG